MKKFSFKNSQLRFRFLCGLITLFVIIAGLRFAENKPVIVENNKSVLVYHLNGGGLKNFSLKPTSFNPYQSSKDSLDGYGHFLIINQGDKGGSLKGSISKMKNISWDLTNSPISKGSNMEMMMKGDFLKEKITVKRWITYPKSDALFQVKEDFYNYSGVTQEYGFQQHITINPALINEGVFYSNVNVQAGGNINLKKIESTTPYGWLIIANPGSGLMIGYVFEKTSYSKIMLETGKKPVIILTTENNGVVSLKSKELQSRKYLSFLQAIDKSFKEVNSLAISEKHLVLEINGGSSKLDAGIVNSWE